MEIIMTSGRLLLAAVLGVGLVIPAAPRAGLAAAQPGTSAAAAVACVPDFPSVVAPDPRATVVMCGLDNPRGLAFGPDGALYVAEAGRGAFGSATDQCFTGAA